MTKTVLEGSTRFEMRVPAALVSTIDEWRRLQPGIPGRSEAVRKLIKKGLEADRSAEERKERNQHGNH